MKRFSLASILFLAAAFGLLSFLLWPSKMEIFSDEDLRVSRVPLPDGSNACSYLAEATRALVMSDDDAKKLGTLLTAGGWDQNAASKILTQNTEALAILRKALACSAAQVPEATSVTNDLPYLAEWKTLTSLLGSKAIALANEGQGKEALDLAMGIVRLGHQLEDADGGTLHWLVASSIKAVGLLRGREIVASTSLDASVLLSFSRQLGDYPVNGLGLTNALKRQYLEVTLSMDELRSGRATSSNAFQQASTSVGMNVVLKRDRSLKLFADGTRVALKAVPVPLASLSGDLISNAPPRAPWKLLLRGNAVGETLYDMWKPSLLNLISRKCEENVNVAATRTLLTLKSYKLAHGDLPDSLAPLVPEYLPALPVDDFSGKPLIYSKEKKIVYSVGRDLQDSGGIERDAKKNRLDSVAAISF